MSVDVRRDPPDYFEYEDHGRRWPFILLALAITLLVLAGSGVMWVQRQVNPSGASGPEVRVTVEQGMSTADVGQLLEREGVITNASIFKYYAASPVSAPSRPGTTSSRRTRTSAPWPRCWRAGPPR